MPVPTVLGRRSALCYLALLLPLQALPASAAVLEGRVVQVADGDTLTIRDDHRRLHKVRIASIDAPERGQAYGQHATAELAKLTHNQHVLVYWKQLDRYQRIIGVVWAAPPDCTACTPDRDIGLALVSTGFAWHYRAYERSQTSDDRQHYRQAEIDARAHHAGLWAEATPTPPWDWRRARHHNRATQH